MDKCTLVAISSALAGASAQYVFSTYLWPKRHRTYSWLFAFRDHKQLGEPCETDLVLDRRGYSLGYSYQYKSALWVSYIISAGSIGIDVERSDHFYADPDIPENYRVHPDDYRNSGYDKGHLAPSAAIDFSRKSNKQTFAMSNVALQDPQLNRWAWRSLERLIRQWTQYKGKLAIITGPLYDENPERVNDIPIPNTFYKIVYAFKHEQAIGFIFPNKDIKSSNLWDYALSITEVEKATGYQFFAPFGEEGQKIKTALDLSWWQEEK